MGQTEVGDSVAIPKLYYEHKGVSHREMSWAVRSLGGPSLCTQPRSPFSLKPTLRNHMIAPFLREKQLLLQVNPQLEHLKSTPLHGLDRLFTP